MTARVRLIHCIIGVLPVFLLLLVFGCAASPVGQPSSDKLLPSFQGHYTEKTLHPAWEPLLRRLETEGMDGTELMTLLMRLDAPSQDPMGRKVRELYTRAFAPKPVTQPSGPKKPVKPRPRLYPGVVTTENVRRCREFLQANVSAFDMGEREYGVPREVAVALLFVETRLGTVLGKEQAFYTLASMAASRSPEYISTYLPRLPDAQSHMDWIQERMEQRSDWAYKELKALIAYAHNAGTDPLSLPGSIYGAIGYCQFMPSNIPHYGADGNKDGAIDLFTVPDAVASLSNYLVKHGWNKAKNRAQRHKVIKSYNRIDIYANTILTLAEAIHKADQKTAE